VARVEEAQSEIKLRRAGANRVVSPYLIGGHRLAHAVLRPAVVDFIELATRQEHVDLQLEETTISARSPLAGSNLRDSNLRAELKVIIVAVKKPSGKMLFNPDPELTIEADDILVAIGPREQLDKLEGLANR
jgi:voltage-gated potassium channel